MIRVRTHGPALLGLVAFFVAGCATAPKKVKPEPEFRSVHQAVNPLVDKSSVDDGMKVSGLMGTLDQSQVQRGVARTFRAATRCYQDIARQRPYVGGSMNMRFRVRRDGAVKHIQLLSSDVGCFTLERCVLAKLAESHFDRPRGGGEAEFTYPITFPTRMASQTWEEARVRHTLKKWRKKRKVRKKLKKLSFPRGLSLTIFVDGEGHLASLGMIADEDIPEDFPQGLVAALETVHFDQPQTHMAKVTYRW
ncbi:MAG: AgmX/PglI C-terminal domain-containing protein [Deltaproteobacteria bacterium]|nr:AgmX/PglI C-terminal domain-containing protein [Deltaproteobacteria bacterium]